MTTKIRLRFGSALIISVAFIISACVSTRLEASNDHPANAKARSRPLPLDSSLGTADLPSPPPTEPPQVAHQHGEALPATGVSYTCTMHPEIVRDAPGNCPICGMKLVKREPPAPKGAEP